MQNNFVLSPISIADLEALIFKSVSNALQSQAPPPQAEPDELVDTNQACKILGRSKPTLKKYRDSGKLKFQVLGNSFRYKRSELMNIDSLPKKYERNY